MECVTVDADQVAAVLAVILKPAPACGDMIHVAIEHRDLDRRLLDEPAYLRFAVAQRLLRVLDVGDVTADADHPHRPALLEMDLAPCSDPAQRPVVLPMNAVLGLVAPSPSGSQAAASALEILGLSSGSARPIIRSGLIAPFGDMPNMARMASVSVATFFTMSRLNAPISPAEARRKRSLAIRSFSAALRWPSASPRRHNARCIASASKQMTAV